MCFFTVLCLQSKWHSLLWVMLYPLAGSSVCSNKELAFTLVIPLLIQDQPYTPNYLLIHPFHTAFLPSFVTAPACWNAGRASSLWRRQQFENCSSNIGLVADLLEEIPSTLECPCGGNTKAELCGWVWEEKCNDLHLNGSTPPNTMGLSFKGVGPHPPTPRIQRGLQGSSTNEAAGISLARYKLLCVKPFSWLEAAPSTSYYFTEWKGFAINDAIMLMELPSCLFASPSTKYQSWWRMRKCKHHCTNSECISVHESELSLEMEALESINNWLGNSRALVHCHLLSHANLRIGRWVEGILLRSNQILDLKGF